MFSNKMAALALATFVSTAALAGTGDIGSGSIASGSDVIVCTFTEPFITTTYDLRKGLLTQEENIEKKVVRTFSVSFQIVSAGVFELIDKDGRVLQTLTLDNDGSDGMSDAVYPYSVKAENILPGTLHGGCVSKRLVAKESL